MEREVCIIWDRGVVYFVASLLVIIVFWQSPALWQALLVHDFLRGTGPVHLSLVLGEDKSLISNNFLLLCSFLMRQNLQNSIYLNVLTPSLLS